MWLSSNSPNLSPATPFITAARREFLSFTVFPSLLLVVSKSANSPLISSSDGYPLAELSIAENIAARSVFRLSFVLAVFAIFSNNWLGYIK